MYNLPLTLKHAERRRITRKQSWIIGAGNDFGDKSTVLIGKGKKGEGQAKETSFQI